jgi:FkbM family methyltransferase
MTSSHASGEIFDSQAPRETVWRDAVKWVSWRLLPRAAYQRLLAYSKAHDFSSGRFRESELDLVESLVRPGDVAIDVGANHGMWTLALSRAVGAEGRVYSFEPVPFTFGVLSAVARRAPFDNVTLVNKGCSDEVGVMEMAIPVQRAGSSDDLGAYLAQRRPPDEGVADESVEVSCEITTLDAELANAREVSLLKVDIEGAELLALRGAANLIGRERPAIVCEVNAGFLEGFGLQSSDIIDFLSAWNYQPHIYNSDASHLERIAKPARIGHANVVFLTEEQCERCSGLDGSFVTRR